MRLVIVGPGALGCSLARHGAACGVSVTLVGRDLAHAQAALGRLQDRGANTQGIKALGLGPEAFAQADVVLEALPEQPDTKAEAWRSWGPWLPTEAARLTGSSSLPVAELDAAAGLQGRLMAFHLFIPVGRMNVVELVVPPTVQPEDQAQALSLARALHLKVVPVQDGPGYAAARMGLVQGLEAMRLLESGAASAEDLDALMVHGYGHPVGPLELSDRVGLDLRYAIAARLFQETGDSRFKPPHILCQLVEKGALGRKTGRGFFTWDKSGKRS